MIDLFQEGQAVRSAFGLPQIHLSVHSATPPPVFRQNSCQREKPSKPTIHRRSTKADGRFRKSATSATPLVFELCMDAFARDGIELTYQDLAFIRATLPIEPGQRDTALATYKNMWLKAMDEEPQEHKKQNKGRFTANTWLRLRSSEKVGKS